MEAAEPTTTQSEEALRPWRRISAMIVVVQLPLTVAVLPLVLFAGESHRTWIYVVAGVALLLELLQWGIARVALGRLPSVSPNDAYASLPLDQSQRRLVTFNLVAVAIAPIVLVLMSPPANFNVVLAVALIVAGFTPGLLSLYRVWRHNSWLAVSRIPGQARRMGHGQSSA